MVGVAVSVHEYYRGGLDAVGERAADLEGALLRGVDGGLARAASECATERITIPSAAAERSFRHDP